MKTQIQINVASSPRRTKYQILEEIEGGGHRAGESVPTVRGWGPSKTPGDSTRRKGWADLAMKIDDTAEMIANLNDNNGKRRWESWNERRRTRISSTTILSTPASTFHQHRSIKNERRRSRGRFVPGTRERRAKEQSSNTIRRLDR